MMHIFLVSLICVFSIIFKNDFSTSITEECSYHECEECDNHFLNEDVHSEEIVLLEYRNHCWRCKASINSNTNKRCSKCGWYICNTCGACESTCPRCPKYNPKSSTDYTWVWILVIGGLAVGGFYLYKKYRSQ